MSKMATIGRMITDNAPTILTAMGAVGLVGTAVLAVKATPEAMRRIEDADSRRVDDYEGANLQPLTKIEQFKAGWKPYIPAALSATVSIACIVSANSIHAKRSAAIVGLYTVSETAFKEYREKIASTIGEKKEREVRSEIAGDRMEANPASGNQVILTGLGEQLCYDQLTGRYFKSDIEKIRQAQNNINAQCINHMYASQNDFYREIGLDPVALGEEVGWRPDRLMDIQFDTKMSDNGIPCISIDYRLQPIRGYYKGY